MTFPNHKKKRGEEMMDETRTLLRVEQMEDGTIRLSKVIEYGSGAQVMIPVIRDGSIKWFDDSKLIRPECRK